MNGGVEFFIVPWISAAVAFAVGYLTGRHDGKLVDMIKQLEKLEKDLSDESRSPAELRSVEDTLQGNGH